MANFTRILTVPICPDGELISVITLRAPTLQELAEIREEVGLAMADGVGEGAIARATASSILSVISGLWVDAVYQLDPEDLGPLLDQMVALVAQTEALRRLPVPQITAVH